MNKTRAAGWLFGLLVCLSSICGGARAWDDDELQVFDVVEEVDQNFYQLMGIPQNANASAIRGAFRKLSLRLHPDKNSAEDAEVRFRNLVAVYDVLKDPAKRERYDRVLVDGLPNWRSAVYYYRHVRKMGLLEMSVILFIVITVGQYLVAWAAYFEKRYTYEQVWGSKLQKMQKKNRKGKMGDVPDLADILEKIPSPSVKNTLPFQLPRWTYASAVGIPSTIRAIADSLEERRRRKRRAAEEEEEEAEEQERRRIIASGQEESEPEPAGGRVARRRRAGFSPKEYSAGETSGAASEFKRETFRTNTDVYEKPKVVAGGGLWTDDDILELIKLVKKYPGGTPDRWEKIADTMSRTVGEVTHMAKKVKDEGLKPGQPNESPVSSLEDQRPKKIKTRVAAVEEEEEEEGDATSELGCSDWSQQQQRALETALAKYPKAGTGLLDRWEKIASCVEGKTKEECQVRYRHLVRLVKKKKNQS